MILTVTPNPAYDVTYTVAELRVGDVHRVDTVHERPGGKGVNVSRVLAQLGTSSCVLGFSDEPFAAAVADLGLDADLLPLLPRVRRTLVITETAGGATTSLWEPGAHVTAADATEQLLRRIQSRLDVATGLVVSGSLPAGVAATLPARVAELGTDAGIPTVCDVSGAALRAAAQVKGVVLVPNSDELAELVGRTPNGVAAVHDAAAELVDAGARAVVATRGAAGMVLVCADGAWAASLPEPLPGNATGAGDAAAAAIVAQLARGDTVATGRRGARQVDWPRLLTDAVATSAAAVAMPVAGEIDPATRARLLPAVGIEQLSQR